MPLLNNRLIPLDKNPGVRPIGIGEVLRRIIGKSLMTVLKSDITRAAGVSQVCAGHPSGCEAAIHALRKVFASMSTDAVLLVDADNASESCSGPSQHPVHLSTSCDDTHKHLPSTVPSVCDWRDGSFLRRRDHSRMPPVHGDVRAERRAIDQQMPECAIHRRPSQSNASVVCR